MMSNILPLTPPDEARYKPDEFDFENPFMDPIELADQLWKNMKHYNGVGLSANQVGFNTKVFVMGSDDFRLNVFNPQVMTLGPKLSHMKEGCLTWPLLFLSIRRPEFCLVSYYDEKGENHKMKFEGLTARIFLHEMDHMNGVDFTQRASKLVLERGVKARDKKIKKMVQQGTLKLPNAA
jgi:peptide deformylase